MTHTWQTVRIFISSTFRDMHAERDWLVKRVFPALREKLEPHRVHLVDIDLRWGITEEQAHKDQVLDLCLNTIHECKPFFLGLVGERYGWVPSPDKLPDTSSELGWTQQHTGKSVTELEILHGVLNDPMMCDRSLFCFRSSRVLQELPWKSLHDFAEFPTEDERRTLSRQDARAAAVGRRQMLRVLKQSIRDRRVAHFEYTSRFAGLRLHWRLLKLDPELTDADRQHLEAVAADGLIDNTEYERLPDHLREIVHRHGVVALSGLEEFGRQVHDWLWQALQAQLSLTDIDPAADPKMDSAGFLVREAGYHERFMELRRHVFKGRKPLLDELESFANGSEEKPCLVTAPSGAGKSAALAQFVKVYQEQHLDALVIPHFVGASPASTNLRQVLLRLCLILKDQFKFVDEVSPDTNSLITLFRKFVAEVPNARRVVQVVDALNQLDEAENAQQLYWLPWQWPAHVKLIASCIADPDRQEPVLKAFTHRKPRLVQVPALTSAERMEIVQAVPLFSAKTLDPLQVSLLLANPATENPLFLLVALDELRGFGSYDQVGQRICQFPVPSASPTDWPAWIAERRIQAAQIADAEERNRYLRQLDRIAPTLLHNVPVDDALDAVFGQVIDRLEADFTPATARTVLPLLASARRGLSDREFLDLLEGPAVEIPNSQTDLFPVLRQLRPYLQHRGTLWDFFHRNLYKAVRDRFLDTDERRSDFHARLTAYFQGQDYFRESLDEQRARAKKLPPTPRPVNIRKVDELPWQMLQVAKLSGKDNPQSPHWDAIAALFTDLNFLEAKAEANE